MQVDIFTVCDAATFNGDSLNILGTFDTITARFFPCVHDSFSVVARVRFAPEDQEHHTLDIHCIDPDGVMVDSSPVEEFSLDFSSRFTETCSLIWNIRGKEFFFEAEYHFELRVDGAYLARVPLYLRERRP